MRAALAELAGQPPAAWRFVADAHGKPSAWLDDHAAAISFNLSHTEGMAGIAAVARPDRALGFDIEPLVRKADLGVADRFFCPQEVAWLEALAEPQRPIGFLRVLTLMEAFFNATGKVLWVKIRTS